jgi:phage tail tape-measure protein
MDEVAFVAHRRSGRLVVRGTLAGHYLDAEQNGDVIGPYTGAGALTGALADAILGAAGLAVGLVSGAAAGGTIQARAAEQLGQRVASVRPSPL